MESSLIKLKCSKSTFLLLAFLSLTVHSFFAQNSTISGVVSDENDQPLPGVNVIVKDKMTGTTTDFDGNFAINASSSDILIFSYVGFVTQEISVENKQTINVILKEDSAKLDEVILVGYGQKSKVTITGAVSTTKGEDLVKSPQANLSNSFAGRLSGVVALNRSGEPGADGSTIRIRGISTTGDNDPLIVVDGIANRLGGLDRLNPNDIESVTVLKDASAAIYGSQAANGVILITTKRGTKGKASVSLTVNQGFTRPANLPELADAPTFATILNEINYYSNPSGGLNQVYTPAEIQTFANGSDPDNYANTDWLKETIRDISLQDSQSLSLRGGGDNVSYFASLGRNSQEGIFEDGINDFEQVNLRSNLDINLTSNLKVGVDVNVRKEDLVFPTNSAGDIFRSLYRTYPTIPARYSNGLPTGGIENGANPILLPTGIPGNDTQETTVVNTTLTFEYKLPFILKGLSLKGFYSEDRNLKSQKEFRTPYNIYQIDNSTNPASFNEFSVGTGDGTAELFQRQDNRKLITTNFRINYSAKIDAHNINAFVAFERQDDQFSRFDAFRNGFLSSQIPQFDLGGGDPTNSTNAGYNEQFTRENYFGRLSYDFAQKYLLELQARYDGSSRFSKGSRYGFFPSISAGWRISQEDWFKSEFIQGLKLKATYGLLGNDRIRPFQYLNSFDLRPTDFMDPNNNPLPIFIINQLANPNITWENARKLDVGFDVDLSNGIGVEFNYFRERREDLLTPRSGSLPWVSGIVNEFDVDAIIPQENIGIVQNNGIETIINYDKKINDKLNVFASANFTYNQNEVVFLDDADGLPEYQVRKGKPLNADLLYEAIGIFRTQADLDNNVTIDGQQLGDLIYRDVNGDGEINDLDKVRQDLTNVPQIVYGFSFGGSYKNFDLNVLFQGQARSVQYVAPESGQVGNFFSSWADNRWSPTNVNGTYPRADVRTSSSINEGLYRNDFWLQNTAFLRLKNIEIGYTLPNEVLSSVGIKSARLYASGFNLATFTKAKDIDPEGDSSNGQFYPQQKIFNIGFNFNF